MKKGRRRRTNAYVGETTTHRRSRCRKGRKRNKFGMEIGLLAAIVVLLFLVLVGSIWWLKQPQESPFLPSDVSEEASVDSKVTEDTTSTEAIEESSQLAESTEAESFQESEADTSQEEFSFSWNYRNSDSRPKVKGIYITGPRAGSAAFQDLLTLVDTTELNAMVIDVKNDSGEITYKMNQETAKAMGACINYIPDMEGFMQKLKEHNVYTIARIVCFKDPYLASNFSELALVKADGTAVVDGHDVAWVNPYKEEVWQYLVDIAKKAGEMGFDEIQFDYVRFPLGTEAEGAQYGVDMTVYPKDQAISDFLQYAMDELHAVGLPVTADVFGTIMDNDVDAERVGQDYAVLGEMLDAICPMVYPSHYANGVFGLAVPDAQPYETILAAMKDSIADLSAVALEEQAVVRPWLQAFTASWVKGHISYGGEQIRDQIQAVYDAGYEEWILWNSSNKYAMDGLLTEE